MKGNQIHVRDTIKLANKLRTERLWKFWKSIFPLQCTPHSILHEVRRNIASTECRSTYEMLYIPFQDDPHHLSSPPTVFEELLPMCSAIAILTFLLHQQGTVIVYMMSAWLIAKAVEKHTHISSLLLYNPPSNSTSFLLVLCSYIM